MFSVKCSELHNNFFLRYHSALKQAQNNNAHQPLKLDNIKDEMDDAQQKMEQCRVRTDSSTERCTDNFILKCSPNFVP